MGTSPDDVMQSFRRTADVDAERTALWVGGREYSYGFLAEQAGRIAGWLRERAGGQLRRVGILAERNVAAYLGLLGARWAGAGYVPLNTGFPPARLQKILDLSKIDALLLDASSLGLLEQLDPWVDPERILLLDSPSTTAGGRGIDGSDKVRATAPVPSPVGTSPESEAYLVFTSGTTGEPNCVAVSVGNLSHAIHALLERHPLGKEDRFSQFFELSFDFSVMDLFVAWQVGAATCVIPPAQRMGPGRFIRDHRLSVWTSVPSDVARMQSLGMLKPGVFPSLRHSFFSGELLAAELARAWQEAAPNCRVVNLYGQTEAPIGSLTQVFGPAARVTEENGSVAIGTALEGVRAAVVGGDGSFLPPGHRGELAVAGPHVARGYINNPALTARKFRGLVHPEWGRLTWYFTGDRAREDADGTFHFLGRSDNEVKISGYRVMLEEVEVHLREVTGRDTVATVAWPTSGHFAQGIAAAVEGPAMDPSALIRALRARVPHFMAPRRILFLDEMPRGINGKVDRRAVLSILESSGPAGEGR
jgi:amino acid adenylation domain-containing protein